MKRARSRRITRAGVSVSMELRCATLPGLVKILRLKSFLNPVVISSLDQNVKASPNQLTLSLEQYIDSHRMTTPKDLLIKAVLHEFIQF